MKWQVNSKNPQFVTQNHQISISQTAKNITPDSQEHYSERILDKDINRMEINISWFMFKIVTSIYFKFG
jgi:hypothetical protein